MKNIKFNLLIALFITIFYIGVRNYVDRKINILSDQYNADISSVYETISRQNDLLMMVIKK